MFIIVIITTGSGNSELAVNLFKEGYTNLTASDYADVCVQAMNKRMEQDGINLKFIVLDVRDMSHFTDGSLDVVLDKATSDAIYLNGDSERNQTDFNRMAAEVLR